MNQYALGVASDPAWFGRDILSVKQFERADLESLFAIAHELREVVSRIGTIDICKGKILANLFYEPSTRTSSSFMAAMQRLGGSVIPISGVQYSSVAKGESLPDTVRTLESYADVIVLRHPEKGAAATAASYTERPIINAGDGAGEHPTQALLDLFTIAEERGTIDGLTVTLVGDLKYGRTVHSLSRLLALFDVEINYVSPESLQMPSDIVESLEEQGARQHFHTSLDEVLPQSDVLYITRVQKERFEDPEHYASVKDAFVITPETMSRAKNNAVLMHPFPRVNEISMEVDKDPRAAYFRQMQYGLFVRMALLARILGRA